MAQISETLTIELNEKEIGELIILGLKARWPDLQLPVDATIQLKHLERLSGFGMNESMVVSYSATIKNVVKKDRTNYPESEVKDRLMEVLYSDQPNSGPEAFPKR